MRLSILYTLLSILAAGSTATPLEKQSVRYPSGFRNTVFNTVASRLPGWPHKTWHSLASHGVSNWIGFTLVPLSANPQNILKSGQAARTIQSLYAAQTPICMDPSQIKSALAAITSSSPPAFLELFNEPDFSYKGSTPLTSPREAAKALRPLFDAKTTTQFISSAVAFPNSDWLTRFRDSCNGCFKKIPIIGVHIYSPDVGIAMGKIRKVHSAFPDKRIWITELGPASALDQGCKLDEQGVINWMRSLV